MKKSGLADSPFFTPPPKKRTLTKPNKPPKSRSSVVPKSVTPEEPKFGSTELPKLRSYEVRRFDELRRLDIRITWEQKRFLDDWEEDLRRDMPEGDRNHPQYQRVTKNSIIRALIEIPRQLDLQIEANKFRNEADLIKGIYEALVKRLANFGSTEVPK